MEFNNEGLKQVMSEAIDHELTTQGLALDPTSVRKVAEAAYGAVMQFFVVGAIHTAIKDREKKDA